MRSKAQRQDNYFFDSYVHQISLRRASQNQLIISVLKYSLVRVPSFHATTKQGVFDTPILNIRMIINLNKGYFRS